MAQPDPLKNQHPALWPLVIKDVESFFIRGVSNRLIQDMKARDLLGRERYGTPLQSFNGRDCLLDAYEEALDLTVYLKQVLTESDSAEIEDAYEMALRMCLQLRQLLDKQQAKK